MNLRSTVFIKTMNINDKSVLEMLNKLIAINRLNKTQILQMVNLVSISNDLNDLKDNLKWESSNLKKISIRHFEPLEKVQMNNLLLKSSQVHSIL